MLCEPSHKGDLRVCLQPQNQTVRVASAVYCTGVKVLPLCEPSQNGCALLLPHAHHQYVLPASTSTPKGLRLAIVASLMCGIPYCIRIAPA
jgi:hypothetical protein